MGRENKRKSVVVFENDRSSKSHDEGKTFRAPVQHKKLGLRPPFCYFFADILSVRGTSWHSVLHR